VKKYLLEIIVFIGGAAVMIFEIVGARVLAPFVGTSIFVWASLIGVILAFLSWGYWWGGKRADKKPDYQSFSMMIFASALFIGLTGFLKLPILNFLQAVVKDIRLEAILASIILFGPASFVLATISPYAARLKIADTVHSGETVGRLYSISTIGSIVGTFLAGFVLVLYLGNTKIILLLSLLMFFTGLLAFYKGLPKAKINILLFVFAGFIALGNFDGLFFQNAVAFLNSQYSDIIIFRGTDIFGNTGRPVLELTTGRGAGQSAIFLDQDDDLVFPYLKFFRLAEHFNPGPKKALMIGAGAYTYPRDFLKRNSEAQIDVVEIDPKITEAARKYFNFKEDPRLTTYHEDGRVYLNKNTRKYDHIFIDAFRSYAIPYQLTTEEAVKKLYQTLNDNGVVAMNIISSITGDEGKFLRAEYATYKKFFPQVYVFRVNYPVASMVQNLILIAVKSDKILPFSDPDPELSAYLTHVWLKEIAADVPVLTDDYAPVDQYAMSIF
jgi:spermidine synthase